MMGDPLATCNTVLTHACDVLNRQVQALAPCTRRCYALGTMLRKLLVGAFVVSVSFTLASFLCLAAGSPAWAQVERKNCPADFHWERMSGICCVQDRETLPENGKIGYVGDSLCIEGYVGVYDHRQTTDGKGVDGCPGYTSFAFLEKCLTPEEHEQFRQQESGGGVTGGSGTATGTGAPGNRIEEAIRDASEALLGGGNGPSPGNLAATGALLGGTALTLLAGSTILGSPVPATPASQAALDRLRDLDRQFEEAARELEAAREARESLYQRRRASEMAAERADWQMARLAEQIARAQANLRIADISKTAWAISGICVAAAGVASALAAYTAASAAGAVAPEAAAAAQAAWASVRQALLRFWAGGAISYAGSMTGRPVGWTALKDTLAQTKANAALIQGRIRADLDHLRDAYDDANKRLDNATERVDKLRSQRTGAAEELRAARQGQ